MFILTDLPLCIKYMTYPCIMLLTFQVILGKHIENKSKETFPSYCMFLHNKSTPLHQKQHFLFHHGAQWINWEGN